MSDRDDDDDYDFDPPPEEGDGGSVEIGPITVSPHDEAPAEEDDYDFAEPPSPAPQSQGRWYDPLIAGIEGATMHSLGRGPMAGPLLDRMAPQFRGQVDQAVQEHPAAHALGNAASGTAAALLAGPSIAAQGAAGMVSGASATANQPCYAGSPGLSG